MTKGRTTLTHPADYLGCACMAHFRNPDDEEARLTKPILDCIEDFEQIGAILHRDRIRLIVKSVTA